MPKQNPYLIENKKPFELVQELKNEVPSFEEFMKTYEVDEGIIDSYNFEVDGYKDIRIGKISGPMPFGDEAALMVAKSDSVMKRLRQNYPTIVELFNHNRRGAVEFLRANGALSGYSVVHNFNVPYTGSGDSVKVWRQYKDKIEDYVDKLARNLRDQNGKGYYEQLVPARDNLTEHVHKKYYDKLPCWPNLYCTNIENIYLDTGSSYEHHPYHMVWSCVGLVRVKDQHPSYDTFSAEFSGEPELKLLVIDYDELTRLEKIVSNRSLQAAKDMIDEKERTRGLLSWDNLK